MGGLIRRVGNVMHTFFLGEGIKFKPRIKIEFAAVLKLGVDVR